MITIKAYANCDHAYVAWQADKPIAQCLGFALYRRPKGQSAQVVTTFVGPDTGPKVAAGTPPVEGSGIDTDVANNNNLAWRNIKVVLPGDTSPASFFIVRNIRERAEPLTLRFEVPPELMRVPDAIHVMLDEALTRALHEGKGTVRGLKADRKEGFVVASPKGEIVGLLLAPRQEGHVRIELCKTPSKVSGDITITQMSPRGVDGGVTLRLSQKGLERGEDRVDPK